jgi:hypothetical protein
MSLPVEIFSGAMERLLPLADYARTIDLQPDILRQALTGQLWGADSHGVNALAKAMRRDPEQVDLTTLPCDESFGAWLKRNMEGITQHGLRARAHLDSQTLKRFLNGDLLPDSDQAERISRALYIDRKEIARVVTANMAAASPSTARQEAAELQAIDRQSNVSAAANTSTDGQSATGTRRRRASAQHIGAEPASSPSTVAPATIDETASAALESGTAATEDASTAGKRPKRPAKPKAQAPAPITAAMATHRPYAESSSLPAVEAQEADRNDGLVAAAAPPGKLELQPATESTSLRKSRLRRQPNQAPTSGPSAPADASANIESDLAAVAAAEQTPAAETNMAADDKPAAEFAAENGSSKRASSRRKPKAAGATATDIASSVEAPSPLAGEIAPSQPDERSADISTDRTAPLVAAELAADITTLQLSLDEVRLIRHWRQLHPHGRRATLHYIGSLLVDD